MEDINRMLSGLNSDVNPSIQPENTTRYMLNFVPVDVDGNVYSVVNESGTVLMDDISFPNNFKVIGYSILNNDIIVILANESGHSQIGYIREIGEVSSYFAVAPINASGNPVNDNSEFGFSLEHPVDCQSRKLISGDRILYYTDNNIPFGFVNLDNPPKVGSVTEQTNLTFSQKIPIIQLKSINENVSSTIKAGAVQFVTRYVTESGGVTNFGIPTDLIPMTTSSKADGVDSYAGAFNEKIVNKSVTIQLSNLDLTYREIEIIAMYYEGDESTFRASRVQRLSLTNDTLEYTYAGPNEEEFLELTQEELVKNNISYKYAKCIEQKDNTLFLSNLRSSNDVSLISTLQEIANSVKVSYEIEELPYSGRGENLKFDEFSFTPLTDPFLSSFKQITLEMTFDVNPSAEDINLFSLHKPERVSKAVISMPTDNVIADGDNIVIDSPDTSQDALTYTARTTPSLSSEFEIGATKEETISNLYNVMLNDTNRTEFNVALSGTSEIMLYWKTAIAGSETTTITVNDVGTPPSIVVEAFNGYSATPVIETPTTVDVFENSIEITFEYPVDYTQDTLEIDEFFNIDDSKSYKTDANLDILETPSYTSSTETLSGFTDYVSEKVSFEKRTFRRDEVYSLGFCLVWNDGTTTENFHIPGRTDITVTSGLTLGKNKDEDWSSYSMVDGSIGKLGCYISNLSYPTNQNYPGNLAGDDTDVPGPTGRERNIRHHLMPSLDNEPHFRKDGDDTFIRIIKLNYEFTKDLETYLPASILRDLKEIIFTRESRHESGNKSIQAQGLVNRMVISADRFTNSGKIETDGGVNNGYLDSYMAQEMPMFDDLEGIHFEGDGREINGSKCNAGVAWPNFDTAGWDSSDYESGGKLSTEILQNQFVFHSPETVLNTGFKLDADSLPNSRMKPCLKLFGKLTRVNFESDKHEYDQTSFWFGTLVYIKKYMYADYFMNYEDIDTSYSIDSPIPISKARLNEPNKYRIADIDTSRLGLQTSTRWNEGGFEILTNGDLPVNGGAVRQIEMRHVPYVLTSENTYIGVKTPGFNKRILYNIEILNDSQYGAVDVGEYLPMTRRNLRTGSVVNSNFSNIYGGDTFISKFAFNKASLINYWPFFAELGAFGVKKALNRPKYSTSQREEGFTNIDDLDLAGSNGTTNNPDGWDIRDCTYYFVESDINTNYRHEDDAELSRSYYPRTTNVSDLLNDYLAFVDGNSSYYNIQYSYENKTRLFFPRASIQKVLNKFENRTIYSDKAANDDTLDAYRSFPQMNYYDLPSNKGPIWDTFVEFGRLFLHTTKSLWLTFAEQAATLESNTVDSVVLGTGHLFARPSQEVFTAEGGYGGTISQFGGTHTQIGYIFPDVLQGKIFGLVVTNDGPQLKELSSEGVSTFVHKELPKGLIIDDSGNQNVSYVTTENAHLIDNPFMGIGLISGYDYKLKRFWIIKHSLGIPTLAGKVETTPFAISFSILLNKWFSYHSYTPNLIIPFNNRTFFVKNPNNDSGSFWEMNTGEKGRFLGESVEPSIVEIVSTKGLGVAKTYQNIIVNSNSDDNGVKVKNDFFNTLQVYNERMNSGIFNLTLQNEFGQFADIGETIVKFANDEYRLAVPRDSVIDNSLDIAVGDDASANLNKAARFKERIKGNFARFRFTYNNTNTNRNFVLRFINIIFNQNIR